MARDSDAEIITGVVLGLQILNAAMPLIEELMSGQRSSISREDILERCKERLDSVDERMRRKLEEVKDGLDS